MLRLVPTRQDGTQRSFAAQSDLGPERDLDSSLVLDGAPRYRTKLLHTTPDEAYRTVLWDCTRGSFRWYFDADEVVYILVGRVIVREDDGRVRRLGPGDTALFTRGTTNVWEVPQYVKKLAIHRLRKPTLRARAFRVARGVRGMLWTAVLRSKSSART